MTAGACDRINAAALLLAAGDPGRPALVCGDQRLDYGALRASVALAGAAWLDCDVLPGELVLLRPLPGLEHAVAFLGAIWAGAVPMPLAAPLDDPARRAHPRIRFVLDLARDGHADSWRDSVMTLAEWRMYLGLARPAAAVAVPADAAACWTDARRRDGGGARLLAHRVALAASPAAEAAPRPVAVSGALGMLRVLRRGGTAVLASPGRGRAGASARSREALLLP